MSITIIYVLNNDENWGVLSIIHLNLKQSELDMGNELRTSNITLIFVGISREGPVFMS